MFWRVRVPSSAGSSSLRQLKILKMKELQSIKVLETMFYVFFWVIPRHLNFICRRFGTLCLFHLHGQVGVEWLNLRIVGLSIQEKVWLKNSLSQLEGGWLGRVGSSYRAGELLRRKHTTYRTWQKFEIKNIGNYSPKDTASQPRRLASFK